MSSRTGWNSECEGFEIVVGRFDFRPFDDGESDGNEDASISLETWRISSGASDGAETTGE